MRIILSMALAILCFSCSTPKPSSVDLDANAAKAALLALMRSAASPFEGADPNRFEKIGLEGKGKGRFGWGAFIIDVRERNYVADVFSDNAFWIYSGKFVVDSAGRCTAQNLSKEHGSKRGL